MLKEDQIEKCIARLVEIKNRIGGGQGVSIEEICRDLRIHPEAASIIRALQAAGLTDNAINIRIGCD